jgi:hypothetical protein
MGEPFMKTFVWQCWAETDIVVTANSVEEAREAAVRFAGDKAANGDYASENNVAAMRQAVARTPALTFACPGAGYVSH